MLKKILKNTQKCYTLSQFLFKGMYSRRVIKVRNNSVLINYTDLAQYSSSVQDIRPTNCFIYTKPTIIIIL